MSALFAGSYALSVVLAYMLGRWHMETKHNLFMMRVWNGLGDIMRSTGREPTYREVRSLLNEDAEATS